VKVIGIRFCDVSKDAEELAGFLGDGLGLPERKMAEADAPFDGAVFPAGESWIEVWPEAPGMPAGIMLQIVVDDADSWAENARKNGLEPAGPMDEHGERIYYLKAPGGLPISFQSKLA
jgi:hypothetical protein